MKFASFDPNSGTLDISAAASEVALQAAALRTLTPTGKQVYVKATEVFLVKQQTIHIGEFIEVSDIDAKRLVAMGRAVIVSAEEVAEAQKAPSSGAKK